MKGIEDSKILPWCAVAANQDLGGGGTLGISGWGCAARTLEPLALPELVSAGFCYPNTRVNSWFP